MNMTAIAPALLLGLVFAAAAVAAPLDVSDSEKPVQHLEVPDVETLQEAKAVFFDTTTQLQAKTQLDAAELHDIHMITYSLEKAVAYFVENSDADMKARAEEMAIVVEKVHLGSENNRVEETRASLAEYFRLAEAFSAGL